MKKKPLIIVFLLFAFGQIKGQETFDDFKIQYDSLIAAGNKRSALSMAQKMNQWALKNEGDTSYAYSISSWYIAQNIGNMDSSLQYAFESLKYFQIKSDTINVNYSIILTKIGNIYTRKAKYAEAETVYLKAAEIIKIRLGEMHFEYATSLNNLAVLYHRMGYFSRCEALNKEALSIRINVLGEGHPDLAMSLNNLGLIYFAQGNYVEAESYFIRSLSIYNTDLNKYAVNTALVLKNLGLVYISLGNYARAITSFQDAEIIIRRLESNDILLLEYAGLSNNQGVLFFEIEDFESAKNYFEKAQAIFSDLVGKNHPEYATTLNNLGLLFKETGHIDKAKLYYKEASEVRKTIFGVEHPDYLQTIENYAGLYFSDGDFKTTENLLNEIVDEKRDLFGSKSLNYARTLASLGVCLKAQGQIENALKLQLECLEIRQNLLSSYSNDLINSYEQVGELYARSGRYIESINSFNNYLNRLSENLENNFAWLSTEQKADYWSAYKHTFTYIPYQSCFIYKRNPHASFVSYNSNLIAKALILDESRFFRNQIIKANDSLIAVNYLRLSLIKQRLLKFENKENMAPSEYNALVYEADSLDKYLIRNLTKYKNLRNHFNIRWQVVQSQLKPYEVAVEFNRYYDYDDTTYKYMAQVIRPGYEYPRIVKLCKEEELTAYSGGQGLPELYKLIWQPLDSLLQGVKTVYYSPDGQLHSIPFHALCVNDSGGCTYLMDQYTLHRLSTTRYLADSSLIKTKTLNPRIALYGGIRYDITPDTLPAKKEESNEDFLLANNLKREMTRGAATYLPGSKAEVETIAPMLNKLQWTTSVSTGKGASESNFKALSDTASPSIIHIATHGFAFPEKEEKKKSRLEMMRLGNEQNRYSAADDPMLRCGLMFAGANRSWTGQQQEMIAQTGEDGILTAAEVANMDLSNTKLVVLSACETGLGKIEGSEGVFGLQRGFKLAGVEQLIVSLWQVPDKETNTLMTRFYADLAITKDPVKSFAMAQREMRERYPDNPELWAGFVLVR